MTFWDRLKFKKKPFKEIEEKSAAAPDRNEKPVTASSVAPRAENKRAFRAVLPSAEASRVLLRPHLSEKASLLAEKSTVVFEVDPGASAAEVARSVKAVYGIDPVKVNMVLMRGRAVRFGRTMGRTKTRKKAIVTLPEGKTIDMLK